MKQNVPYLFDNPHWQVDPVLDLDIFFANLPGMVPPESVLCLAEGSWSKEGKVFIRTHMQPNSAAPSLPSEFQDAPRIPVNKETMLTLSEMATRHAAPEIAIHLCVCTRDTSILEWYDLTGDPITISLSVPEVEVARFAGKCGVRFRIQE